jgi:hypothetical protein
LFFIYATCESNIEGKKKKKKSQGGDDEWMQREEQVQKHMQPKE